MSTREKTTDKPQEPSGCELRASAGYAFDDDRNKVRHGDTVFFSYGIPPVRVIAPVIQRGKKLIVLTHGHNPPECDLRRLRKLVGGWFKHNDD